MNALDWAPAISVLVCGPWLVLSAAAVLYSRAVTGLPPPPRLRVALAARRDWRALFLDPATAGWALSGAALLAAIHAPARDGLGRATLLIAAVGLPVVRVSLATLVAARDSVEAKWLVGGWAGVMLPLLLTLTVGTASSQRGIGAWGHPCAVWLYAVALSAFGTLGLSWATMHMPRLGQRRAFDWYFTLCALPATWAGPVAAAAASGSLSTAHRLPCVLAACAGPALAAFRTAAVLRGDPATRRALAGALAPSAALGVFPHVLSIGCPATVLCALFFADTAEGGGGALVGALLLSPFSFYSGLVLACGRTSWTYQYAAWLCLAPVAVAGTPCLCLWLVRSASTEAVYLELVGATRLMAFLAPGAALVWYAITWLRRTMVLLNLHVGHESRLLPALVNGACLFVFIPFGVALPVMHASTVESFGPITYRSFAALAAFLCMGGVATGAILLNMQMERLAREKYAKVRFPSRRCAPQCCLLPWSRRRRLAVPPLTPPPR